MSWKNKKEKKKSKKKWENIFRKKQKKDVKVGMEESDVLQKTSGDEELEITQGIGEFQTEGAPAS